MLPAHLPEPPERKQDHRAGSEEVVRDDVASDSESCDDVHTDATSFMPRTVKKSALPRAFKTRGDHITKGMVVAVPCAAAEGEQHAAHAASADGLGAAANAALAAAAAARAMPGKQLI